MGPPLTIGLRHAGRDLTVTVEVGPNHEPEAIGSPAEAHGFPVCRATIGPPARGYVDALGWIQLVASGETDGEFAIDPFEPLGKTPHPFCFFGFAPTLFDAPHRPRRPAMDWVAASFLAEVSGERRAAALIGFSWGFRLDDGEVEIVPPTRLEDDSDWDRHLSTLGAAHPTWEFDPGLARPANGAEGAR